MIKTLRESLGLLATRRFGTFWFASLLSNIGTWAQQVAEPWLLLTLGASALVIGLDSFAMNAPVIALTLVGGALADRSDRRRVIALFQSIQMLCPTVIVILLIAHRVQPWMIVALSVIVGITDALSMPSFQSIVPSIVKREQIDAALALNSTQFNLSRILGPSIAGVLMASVGATASFVVSAASYVPFIGVALWILPRRAIAPPSSVPHTRRNPFTGIGEILRQRQVGGALLTVATTSLLCAPIVTFTPLLVREEFHGGAGRFSTAVAAFGVGGLLGATSLLAVPRRIDRRVLSAACGLCYALVLVLTAFNPWFWGVPALLVIAGSSMAVSNTSANSLLQSTAKPDQLGQTVSLFMLAVRGGMSLGAVITGATVSALGVRRALLVNGVIAIVIQVVVARRWLSGRTATARHRSEPSDVVEEP